MGRNTFSEVFVIPLSSAGSSGLAWCKIPRSRSYELKLKGEVVGTLRRPSCWSSKVLAEFPDGRWTFHRCGLLGTGSEIVDSASEQGIATFKSTWSGGGTLTFADGQTFQVERRGWWRPVWSVMAEGGQPLLHFYAREKTVELSPDAAVPESRLLLLFMFTKYRVLQAEEDAAAATVAAVVASS